jgi:hypothetical protein
MTSVCVAAYCFAVHALRLDIFASLADHTWSTAAPYRQCFRGPGMVIEAVFESLVFL